MLLTATTEKGRLFEALELIEACRVSSSMRAAYCRQLNAIIETGREDGTKSLINMLFRHHDRLSSHLFSPTDLRATVDFEYEYPKNVLDRAKVVGRALSRDWQRNNTDIVFGQGVFESLKYGACFLKQWVQQESEDQLPVYYKRLVMPWSFGVYNESETDLSRQPAMCETTMLTLPEVWRRIYHLPEARSLYERIKKHAKRQTDQPNSFFHQVLSTATLNTGNIGLTRPTPGGIVQLNNDPNYAIIGPNIGVDLVQMHELWVWGEKDWVTVQVIEPDILLTRYKKTNLLIPGDHNTGLHPYTLIQSNPQATYLFGRPESFDLIQPQGLLSTWADDIKRLFGLQIDKILGFTGDGLTDEQYNMGRNAGYWNLGAGADVKDLTPKFPDNAIQMLELLIKIIDMIGGFDNILSGRGEQGVRAGSHANTLLKTASPSLRDRALMVERQCASALDLRLRLMEAKDPRNYWTDGSSETAMEETSFMLSDLPEDGRASVDSHSSSPIFADDHQNLVAFGLKAGICDNHYAADNLPFPQKEVLHQSIRERDEQNAKLMQQLAQRDPEGFAKMLEKRRAGGHR